MKIITLSQILLWLALLLLDQTAWGFLSPSTSTTRSPLVNNNINLLPITTPAASSSSLTRSNGRVVVSRGPRSSSSMRLYGIFGLGVGEIVVILVVVGFVLGPQNIGRLLRSSADRASALQEELEKVPEEFQKGMEEGESSVRARKARVIKVTKDKEAEKEE